MSCFKECEETCMLVDDCCSVVDRKGWSRVTLNIAVVLLYQALRTCYRSDEEFDAHSTSSYIFLIAATLWVTAIDLQPACLSISAPFLVTYDVVAVTVFANLMLNYVWSEILLFTNTVTYHIYIYSEDTKLGEVVQCIFDKDAGLICFADVVASLILLWVLKGVGIICSLQEVSMSLMNKFKSDDTSEIVEEISRCITKICTNKKKKKRKC